MNTKNVITTLVLACVLIGGFFALYTYTHTTKQNNQNIVSNPVATSYAADLTGRFICLTPKVGVVATKECRFGLVLATGEQYALDFNRLNQIPSIQNGRRFTAEGLVTPVESLSSDEWQKYEIRGIFSVTEIIEVEELE